MEYGSHPSAFRQTKEQRQTKHNIARNTNFHSLLASQCRKIYSVSQNQDIERNELALMVKYILLKCQNYIFYYNLTLLCHYFLLYNIVIRLHDFLIIVSK